ncbi:anti-phage ZorAB system protein ZorA [Cellulosimicrobium sp. NPDC055967]|uniref:anti-phage ZorAB system protein ZorA n=1 Tax=Cellulosimicrobium sp. NPDC055967 TaxID=3345670 RepID=UPI0035D5B8A5
MNPVTLISEALEGDGHAIIICVAVALIVLVALWAVAYTVRAYMLGVKAIAQVRTLISVLDAENASSVRRELRGRAMAPGRGNALWREFDETLVVLDDDRLSNTVEAEHYFSPDRFAPELVRNRLLGAAPSILTALGLLGTFIGLAVGLNGLNLSQAATADEMRTGIEALVKGAGLGFIASVWGVLCSLVVNILEKICSRSISKHAAEVRDQVDQVFLLQTPEHSLVRIEQFTQDSATALAELHEKIGTKLQEAVTGLSEEMQSALTRAIETAVAPSMNALAERTSNQSAQVFEDLVDKFTESFRGIGERQAAELGSASATLDNALTGVSDRVGAAVASMQEAAAAQAAATTAQTAAQERQIAEQEESFRSQMSERTQAFEAEMSTLTELVTSQAKILDGSLSALAVGMDAAAGKLGAATTGLQRSSELLGSTSRAFETTSRRLEESFDAGATALAGTAEAHQEASRLLDRHTTELDRLTETTAATAGKLLTAAQSANTAFDTLRASQRQFLDDLQQRVENQSAVLREWLDEYGDKVHHQTRDRLETWDAHTREFAAHMLQTSQALAEVVDEIDAKAKVSARA